MPGLLGAETLASLYAIEAGIEPSVELLLQHRALLCVQHWPLAPALQRVLVFDLVSIALLLAGLTAEGKHLQRRSSASPQ